VGGLQAKPYSSNPEIRHGQWSYEESAEDWHALFRKEALLQDLQEVSEVQGSEINNFRGVNNHPQ